MIALLVLLCLPLYAQAEEKKTKLSLPRYNSPSTNMTGMLGLNTIPSARMDPVGTIRIGTSTSDPYAHGFLGFQIAKPLTINMRQTAEISSLLTSADRLYPGMDFKLRLMEETATRPAVAIGIDSAFGHKRMASEYLTLSKRFNNFDITSGLAWGRLGSAGHLKNPLRSISSHFEETRDYNSEQPQNTSDWFTGKDIGFFGGIEYYTPLQGLSIKADYGANDYVGERTIDGFDTPAPWSIGVNYKPWEQIDLSAGVIGGKKIMARLSLQDKIYNWPGKPSSHKKELPRSYSEPGDEKGNTRADIHLSSYHSTGRQIGYATRFAMSQTDDTTKTITIPLQHKGLKGPRLKFIRKDIETAVRNNHGSPEEIWQDLSIDKNIDHGFSLSGLKKELNDAQEYDRQFRFILENKLSLSEEDQGTLYRSALLIDAEKQWPFGFITGTQARLNITDNLSNIRQFRTSSSRATRSDEDLFAGRSALVNRFYGAILKSINSDLHIGLNAGYLEEMFAGYGGEILYRPFNKRFAIGGEGWKVFKRDALSPLGKKFFSQSRNTGHINLYYELPDNMTTLYGKAGKYLAGDTGLTLGLQRKFKNGARLEGFITGPDQADIDIFGDATHLYGGIRLSLPFGQFKFIPQGSEVRFETTPFARDAGQILDHPLPLYDVTEPISYRQLRHSWQEILD